jgi:type II secretory pathway pseudopilin PulG
MHLKECIRSREAFTRVELLIVLIAVGLLGAVGLSGLAGTADRSDLVVCANNLRQVGRAFHMWASDHGGENPWWTSYSDGGSYVSAGGPPPPGGIINVPGFGPAPAAVRGNAWVQFGFINQELQTPAPLVCPTDRTKFRASDFSKTPNQGYFALDAQNRAVSYFVGMHAFNRAPWSMLSGDRSLKEDGFASGCPANVGPLSFISLPFQSGGFQPKGWSSDLHLGAGNVLLNDGRVEELSQTGLGRFMGLSTDDDNGVSHFLKPF